MTHQAPFPLQCTTFSGEDAAAFAQSQFTADLNQLPEARWTPVGWCDPKGRTLAVLLVVAEPGRVRVALPRPLAADVIRRLGMYTIGRKVTISGLVDLAPTPDASKGTPLAYDPDRSLTEGEPADDDAWRRWLARDIDHNVAWLLPETAGTFLPQMLGLESHGGLSYRKGCWPGQEVVARVHYRGTVKRFAQRFDGAGAPPEPGRRIVVEDRNATVLYALPASGPEHRHFGVAVVDVAPPGRADGDAV